MLTVTLTIQLSSEEWATVARDVAHMQAFIERERGSDVWSLEKSLYTMFHIGMLQLRRRYEEDDAELRRQRDAKSQ